MTVESAENALQVAIYDALVADVAISASDVTGIFDHIPQTQNFPYIEIGEIQAADWDSDTHNGQDHTVTINVWSQKAGRKETKSIQKLIYTLLHNSTLSISGHTIILARQTFSETLKDPDGETHHGVQRFRFITADDP